MKALCLHTWEAIIFEVLKLRGPGTCLKYMLVQNFTNAKCANIFLPLICSPGEAKPDLNEVEQLKTYSFM